MKSSKTRSKAAVATPFVDQQSIETKALLEQCRALLPPQQKEERAKPSPFAYAPQFVKEMQARDKQKKRAKAAKIKPNADPDELMAHYLSQNQATVPFTSDEMRGRSILMPYNDVLVMVDEKVKLVTAWKESIDGMRLEIEQSIGRSNQLDSPPPPGDDDDDDISSSNKSNSSLKRLLSKKSNPITIQKLLRRYPRLCSMLRLGNSDLDISDVRLRSNVWLVNFMEECYDEAFSYCYKLVSDSRRRKRCGLDLGALDAFPLVAQRLLTRTFSILEMRQRVCLEMLLTLESAISIGEESLLGISPTTDLPSSHDTIMIDGGRAQIFAKFLSEELDLDYLAVYIHSRDLIQKELSIRLVDVNPHHHLHVDTSVADNLLTTGFERTVKNTDRSKGAVDRASEGDIVLSASLDMLHNDYLGYTLDATLPYAPLLSFNASKLLWLCGNLVPEASPRLRQYLAGKVTKRCERLFEQGRMRLDSPSSIAAAPSPLIPVSILLEIINDEWRAVPVDAKSNISDTGNTAESLRVLNDIYDGDNAKMKAFAKMIRDVEAELAICDSNLLKLDKNRRRLERKWKNNLASAAELLELQNVRVAQTETKAERTTIETRLFIVKKREKIVKDSLDGLWSAASVSTEVELVPEVESGETKVAPSTWRADVAGIVLSAISYNEEAIVAIQAARDAIDRTMHQQEQLVMDQAKRLAVKEESEPTISEQIAALERDALELSRLGQAELLELGIQPPKPPDFIQAFVDSKEQEALRVQEMEREVLLEAARADSMAREEAFMRSFYNDERFFIQHNIRVMEFEEARMRAAMAEEAAIRLRAVSTIAESEIGVIINGALRGIAHATMIREIEAVLKSQAEEEARAMEALALQARVKKSIEVLVGSFVSMATSIAHERVLEHARRAQAEELMRARIIAISNLATNEVGFLLEGAVSKIVHEAIQEILVAEQLARQKFLQEQRLAFIRDDAVRVVSDVISTAHDAALEHYDRLELEEMIAKEERIDELATQVVSSLRDDIEVGEVDAAVELAIDLAIDEAAEAEALKAKQAAEAARARRFLLFQAKKTGRALVSIVISSATIAAKNVLTDPWLPMELEPHEFLSEDLLGQVEEMFIISSMKNVFEQKLRSFKVFRYPVVFRRNQQQRVKETWQYMRSLVLRRKLRDTMIRRMQRAARDYIAMRERRIFVAYLRGCNSRSDVVAMKYRQQRAKKYIQYWKYWSHAQCRAKNVRFNVRERRFLICYYTWRMHFKNAMDKKQSQGVICEAAALKIQRAGRRKLAYLRCKRIRAHLTLVSLGKRFFARRRVRQIRRRARLLYENSQMQVRMSKTACMRVHYKVWRRYFAISHGLDVLRKFTMRKLVRKRFLLWKRGYQDLSKILNKCATKVQSAVRMWIIKRYVLNFYKWRRGIISLQAQGRRRILIPIFRFRLMLFRAAKAIQRLFRGYSTRVTMTQRRIADLHYAAAANNYERLRYYAQKYRSLLYELDEEGNSALHNAAKRSARRTLKLLLRYQLEPNAVNYNGYSALHLAIMSAAVNRDECVLYMLERGFDEDQLAPGGKTCLLLASENGRNVIVSQLLANGMDPNASDDTGLTCLQAACTSGFLGVAKELVVNGADVNAPGYCGTTPLHDCIATGNIEFPNLLISHGAYVNVVEPFNHQSPLMWASRAGLPEFVQLYVFQGAHVNAKDNLGWTAAHHGATSDNEDVYEALRVGDTDFDAIDHEGNTPLHVAGQYGSDKYAIALLLGCVNPSVQNKDGDQPSHIAARDNNLEVLKRICIYDTHIGRLNFSHRTPLGMAKFFNAPDTRAFLEEHYRKVDVENGRNAVGDIWWDRAVDQIADDWKVVTGFLGEREYVNRKTGERSLLPPSVSSVSFVKKAANFVELPIQRRVVLVDEENTLTRHGYKKEYAEFGSEVSAMSRIHRAAVCVQKFAFRKLAYLQLARLRHQKKKLRMIGAFIRRRIGRFMRGILAHRNRQIARVQAAFRGDKMRREFYHQEGGRRHMELVKARAKRVLGRQLLRVYRGWKNELAIKAREISANLPRTIDEWNLLVVEARVPMRTVGMFEEYLYPGTRSIFFYRHKISHECAFDKPLKMKTIDEAVFRDAEQIRRFGCTTAQRALTVKLQALWRGYKIRSYYIYVEVAMNISLQAEKKYLTAPDTDNNLYNYALHCHCILHDYTRARTLYYESMRRMEWRGPDVAFVLYSYAVFAMYTHDLDTADVLGLLERGRKAEETREIQLRRAKGQEASQAIAKGTFRHGQVFELANIGYFRNYATEHEDEPSWHNYALCRFLIFNDFATSFDAFLMAFKYAPSNEKLKTNFDTMMTHFHGDIKTVRQKVVRDRMAYLAAKDLENINLATQRREYARDRANAGRRINNWIRIIYNRHKFKQFLEQKKMMRRGLIPIKR